MPKFMVLMVRGMTVSLNPIEVITLESHDTEIQLNARPEQGDTSFGIKIEASRLAAYVDCRYGHFCNHPSDEGLQISVFDIEDVRQVELVMASLQFLTWKYSRKKISKNILDMKSTSDD